eukprot:7755181-Pyramimonas_sp.AAC.1
MAIWRIYSAESGTDQSADGNKMYTGRAHERGDPRRACSREDLQRAPEVTPSSSVSPRPAGRDNRSEKKVRHNPTVESAGRRIGKYCEG